MNKEKEILDKTLTFNYGEMLDIIKNHISTLRFVAISSVNSLEEKDKEIERLNKIINELEKFTNARIQKCYDEGCYIQEFDIYCEYDSKIKELRGDSK